ncbi:hypothetical protein BKA70DRAFT_1380820 [Coprinopsis sp. MPI-PUGE-AT-0042]|nr:hypothetical protein BKA70DRAFT_1380820 [Coprinopsis sp. MPI-PUGE-AT-0042]
MSDPSVPRLVKHDPHRRRLYGTSHLKLVDRVDVVAPTGSFVQTGSFKLPSKVSSTRRHKGSTSPRKSLSPTKSRTPKHISQYNNWIRTTIPKVIPAYLELMRCTDSLRNFSKISHPSCRCMPTVHRLRVVCALQDRIDEVEVCSCSAAVHLVQLGFFPSSPKRPSFAVDLRMLDFAQDLSFRSSFNVTAWCGAMEANLSKRGYILDGKDVIRRKFSMAMKWYIYMVAQADLVVDDFVANAMDGDEEDVLDQEPSPATDYVEHDHTIHSHEASETSLPSDYLQSRCILCFPPVRSTTHLRADVVVCLDTNFTQKRRNAARGEARSVPLSHPTTVFLTTDEVARAKAHVERLRNDAKKTRNTKADDDTIEPGLQVPTSALDGCLESFTAADEKRIKASTAIFADTGIMGLLCRHDNVLWLVNMTTAGERQFYAIALILKLFRHLPDDMTVGLLYDVACQLHRSSVKWGFLEDYINRMIWSVSVFHAYGHQWPCQLIYHPRKCLGFGLSDGEGCERFWDAIKLLIPTLRVSGYHQRLFAIDNQVAYLTRKSQRALGLWLARKWRQCSEKKAEALDILSSSPHAIPTLEAQWHLQVQAQTTPLPRVSKASAKKAVEQVLSLVSLHDGLKKELARVTKQLEAMSQSSNSDVDELTATSLELSSQITNLATCISERKAKLGVEGRKSLKTMANDTFLQLRLNAAALKERILSKLKSRKFELERLDRAARSSNDTKLHAHIQSQVSRHQPNIIKLVKRYNEICDEMATLNNKRKTPAIIPCKIDRDTLFSLDVDNSIWDSRGLGSDDQNPPLWMADESVMAGIRAWLQLERCQEEEGRLLAERIGMAAWCQKQWYAISSALENITHPDIVYPLLRHHMPADDDIVWGPPDNDITASRSQRQSQLIKLDAFQPILSNSDGVNELVDEQGWETDSDLEDPNNLLDTVDDFYLDLFLGSDIGVTDEL